MNRKAVFQDKNRQLASTQSVPNSDSRVGGADSSLPDSVPPPLAPARFGRYRVDAVLGGGSFGLVCQGFDEQLNRPVAIKVSHSHCLGSPEQIERFKAEARIVAGLDHPRIVPVYDVGETDDGQVYFVAKLIEGGSLARRLAEQRLDGHAAAELTADVAEALDYAHRQGLVHRDVKPSNILLDGSGQPLVADFGLAVHETQQRCHRDDVSGSPAYMAPEQVRGQSHFLDGRSDIWALGVVLYELLTGRRPFAGESLDELFEEIQRREPKPPRMVDASIPAELERIVLRCLEKEVTRRYSTAADLAADLRDWLGPTNTTSTADPSPNRRTWWQIAGCAAAMLLLIALAWIPLRSVWTTPSAPVAQALEARLDIRLWNARDELRSGLSIEDPGALPLEDGDLIRIEVELNRPAYVYLLWITPGASVQPLYPWTPGDWNELAVSQRPTQWISLPAEGHGGWSIQGESGMETLLLLADDAPLPDDFAWQSFLEGFPVWQQPDPRALVRLEGDTTPGIVLRGIHFDVRQIDDPLLEIRQFLEERVRPHFMLLRGVSFANGG